MPARPAANLLPNVRGELLMRIGRNEEARTELERASSMCRNERERAVLRRKIIELGDYGRTDTKNG